METDQTIVLAKDTKVKEERGDASQILTKKKNLRGTCVISGFDVSFAASLVLALLFYCSFFLRKEKVVIVSKYFKGSF